MKFAEINKRFTEKVAEWMARGYHINTSTMSGHQGEIAKVDLTNGKEIVRVVIENHYHMDEKYVELVVGHSKDIATPDANDTWGTIWNNHLEVVSSERFWLASDGYDSKTDWYITEEEHKLNAKKRHERYGNQERDYYFVCLPEKAKKVVLQFVRKQPKCKSVQLSEIDVKKRVDVRRNGVASASYIVFARNNQFKLR